MPERAVIQHMPAALEQRVFPSVTTWNRLEARPRTPEFDRALAAEIRDPLWMVCRQWQLGEYRADDAGSPISAKTQVATTRLATYQPADHPARPFPDDRPVEAQVECRPLAFDLAGQRISLALRLLMGRQWLRMLAVAVGDFSSEYRQRYPIPPVDSDAEASAPVAAHLEAWQQWSAVAGRMMDGFALYHHLVDNPTHHAHDGISLPAHLHGDVDDVAARFIAWFEALILQPEADADHAWRPPYLEYQFSCGAPSGPAETVYSAEEYYHGRLDWYNLELDGGRSVLGDATPPSAPEPPVITSFVPGQVSFDGMPNSRWWTFEDSKVNLGDVSPSTTDLGALLFLEFGLIYANDWFVVPLALAAGSIATVQGLAVTNVFGERTWVESAGRRTSDDWQSWGMFEVSLKGAEGRRGQPGLVQLASAAKIQDGPVLEDISLIRDEVANMVWGVETHLQLPSGASKPAQEAARELRLFLQSRLERAQQAGTIDERNVAYAAPVRYKVMNDVPENWIPFIPVHVEGSHRQIQLQRAALPRILANDPRPPVKVEPRTILLRDGLDRPAPAPFYVHEEEVPRAGTRLFQSFRRTRWYGGRVVTWLGVGKQTGRGEGTSGLAFDTLVPVTSQTVEE
jgi:hypothetical protein